MSRWFVVLLLCLSRAALAAEPATLETPPWAEGVSQDEQDTGKAYFQEGNKYLQMLDYKTAAYFYQKALEHWKHPATYYNLSIALERSGQLLAAYKVLSHALEHGPAPFASPDTSPDTSSEASSDTYAAAQKRMDAFRGRIAHLEVVCEQQGVLVTLDGESLFVGPGRFVGPVLAGEHRVGAARGGHVADFMEVSLAAGARTPVVLEVVRPADWLARHRPLSWFLPWLLVFAGVLVAAAGMSVRAAVPRRLSRGLLILGGVLVVVGLLAVFLSRPVSDPPHIDVAPVPAGAPADPVPKGSATK